MLLGLAVIAATGAQPLAAQVTVETALGTAVVDRMIDGEADEFSSDVGTLYFWSRVTDGADMTIQHVWIYGDYEEVVELAIGGSPWRTWSSRNILPEWAGEWRIEVRDEQGNVLDTQRFTIS